MVSSANVININASGTLLSRFVHICRSSKVKLDQTKRDTTTLADVVINPNMQHIRTWDVSRHNLAALYAVVGLHLSVLVGVQQGLMQKTTIKQNAEKIYISYIAPNPPSVVTAPSKNANTNAVLSKKPLLANGALAVESINSTPSPKDALTVTASESVAVPSTAPTVSLPDQITTTITNSLPKTISTGIEYLQTPQPDYPPLAKRAGEQGRVLLRILVNDRGMPESASVQQSSGFVRLDEAARVAALRARFKPFTEAGKAIAAYVIVPISFQLD